MASLTAIKDNYKLLTKQERFGLYQKASLRNDESELRAIEIATPMKTFDVIDFYFIREEIFRIDTVNLLQRLGHFYMYETFMNYANREKEEFERHLDSARLSAYLYKIETNAWEIVCDELGFEVNWFRHTTQVLSFAVEMMELKNDGMQEMAFTKDEATEFMREIWEVDNFDIKTIEQQIKLYKHLLEEV